MANPAGPDPRPPYARPDALLAVALGGLLGSTLRYAVSLAMPHEASQWPGSTLLVNLLGAFCLGMLLASLSQLGPDAGRRQLLRLALGTGLLGSLTTYSTLALDVVQLLESRQAAMAGGYAALSVVAGVLAATLGVLAGTRLGRSRDWRHRRSAP